MSGGIGQAVRDRGVQAALMAAVLFGAATPLAKLLLGSVSPWVMAGLLYLGSGVGLTLYRLMTRAPRARLARGDVVWFAGGIVSGGIAAPILLMLGLSHLPASDASLLLNAEGIFTTLLAWFVFREHFDARIAAGMAAIVAGAVVLTWPAEGAGTGAVLPSLAVLGACLAWGIDNNLTRKVSLTDATWIAAAKGLVAGTVNLMLAFAIGAALPPPAATAGAMTVGFFAYGVSLALFVVGLRHLGTARTGAYFSAAPFIGALLGLALGDAVTWPLLIAFALMALGLALHLTERHAHLHAHEAMEHDHEHEHDAHHQHAHDVPVPPGTRHRHPHRHEPLVHAHAHYPDMHHQHSH